MKKSEFLKAWGKAFEIFRSLVNAILEAGGDDEDVERLQTLRVEIAKMVIAARSASKDANTYPLAVNYDLSVEDAVAAGGYNWSDGAVTNERYPTSRKGQAQIEVILLHFKKMTSEEVLAEMDKKGLRPAELHELLALSARYPDLRRQFAIIALGSVWQLHAGYRLVPCLREDGSERDLRLNWFGSGWDDCCRFAAVRKTA